MDTLEFFNENKTLIVAFSGYAQQFGEIQPFEFMNFLKSRILQHIIVELKAFQQI